MLPREPKLGIAISGCGLASPDGGWRALARSGVDGLSQRVGAFVRPALGGGPAVFWRLFLGLGIAWALPPRRIDELAAEA